MYVSGCDVFPCVYKPCMTNAHARMHTVRTTHVYMHAMETLSAYVSVHILLPFVCVHGDAALLLLYAHASTVPLLMLTITP